MVYLSQRWRAEPRSLWHCWWNSLCGAKKHLSPVRTIILKYLQANYACARWGTTQSGGFNTVGLISVTACLPERFVSEEELRDWKGRLGMLNPPCLDSHEAQTGWGWLCWSLSSPVCRSAVPFHNNFPVLRGGGVTAEDTSGSSHSSCDTSSSSCCGRGCLIDLILWACYHTI